MAKVNLVAAAATIVVIIIIIVFDPLSSEVVGRPLAELCLVTSYLSQRVRRPLPL